jgi:hypothetical protein
MSQKKFSVGCAVVLVAGMVVASSAQAAKWPFHKKDKDQQAEQADAKPQEAAPKTTEDGGRVVKGKNNIEGEIIGTAAPGSPFNKLEIGMSDNQVRDLIGSGKECGTYMTGKAWIPFHFGSDNSRQECNYAGAGRLIFSNQASGASYLLKIVNDASEDGYR